MSTLASKVVEAARSRMLPALAPVRRILAEGGHAGPSRALAMRDGSMWTEGEAIFVRLEPPRDEGPVRIDDLDRSRNLAEAHSLVMHLAVAAATTRIRGPASGDLPYLAFADGPRTFASANILRLEAEATYRRDMKALAASAASVHEQLSEDFPLGERSLLFSTGSGGGEIAAVSGRDPGTRGVYLRMEGGRGAVVLVGDWKGARSSVGLHLVDDVGSFAASLSSGRIPPTPFGMRFGPDMLPHGADALALCDASEAASSAMATFEALRPLLASDTPDDGTFQVLDEAALAFSHSTVNLP